MSSDIQDELRMVIRNLYEASEVADLNPVALQKHVTSLNQTFRLLHGGQTIAGLVQEWVEGGQGRFFINQMFTELGLASRADKKAADMALRRLAKKGLVTECGEQRGCWRPIVNGLSELEWEEADTNDTIPIKWPLGLEEYFTIYPTNVVVVAGEKNAGKTSFMLNLVYLNALSLDMPIRYYSSEMAKQELSVRLKLFPSLDPFKQAKFYPLNIDSVVDVIEEDAVNIIDFLEIEDEFWLVGKKIRKMWEKLGRGIVIVAVQKDEGSKLGRGKAFSTEKARVYLTMTKKQNMTLAEIKNYVGEKKPDGTIISYVFNKHALLERRPVANKLKEYGYAP